MEDGLSPQMMQSFAKNRGKRGVHFYDALECTFVAWEEALKASDRFPDNFAEKLVEAMANYDPEREFVTVTAGNGQLTIELFKAQDL